MPRRRNGEPLGLMGLEHLPASLRRWSWAPKGPLDCISLSSRPFTGASLPTAYTSISAVGHCPVSPQIAVTLERGREVFSSLNHFPAEGEPQLHRCWCVSEKACRGTQRETSRWMALDGKQLCSGWGCNLRILESEWWNLLVANLTGCSGPRPAGIQVRASALPVQLWAVNLTEAQLPPLQDGRITMCQVFKASPRVSTQ